MDARKRAPGRAFCPNCGQKYAVPEEELKRHPGLRFRATCRNCDTPFSVRWQDDGLITDIEELEAALGGERDVLRKGTRVGKYEIEEMLASGGSATVYRAFELGANRTVALKVLHRAPDSDYGVRFRREVEVQGNLKHPNLMPIFDQGVIEQKPYYTMELLHKPTTLETIVALYRGRRLNYNPALRSLDSLEALLRNVILPVARAVGFANSNGVVHRDLKPGNVIVDARTLHVYVIDFGICHVFKSSGHRLVLRGDDDQSKDMDNRRAMGTVRFMPPEQARGDVDEQSDIWQLGALVHYVLAGEGPIAGAIDLGRVSLEKRVANLQKIAESSREAGDEDDAKDYERRIEELKSGSVRAPKDVLRDAQDARYKPLPDGVDPALAAIIQRAMFPEPRLRYRDAGVFADEIRRYLDGRPVRAYVGTLNPGVAAFYRGRLLYKRNRTLLLTVTAALLLALALGVFLALRSSSERRSQLAAWMNDARTSTKPLVQEDRLTKVLALQPDHAEAQELLALTRRFLPLKQKLERAQVTRRRVVGLRNDRQHDAAAQLAEDTAAVLEGSVIPDLESLPADYPGRHLLPDARELAQYLRGRRLLRVTAVPAGVQVGLVPPTSRFNPALLWNKVRDWGTAPLANAEHTLEPGSYVLVFSRGGRKIYHPFHIRHATAKRVEAPCPIDPAKLPDGMIYVSAATGMLFGDLRFTERTRKVDVAAFFLDAREVTNAEYARYLNQLEGQRRGRAVPRRLLQGPGDATDPLWNERDDGTWAPPDGTALEPVTAISYLDASDYARWAGKRLPRPEEWELAARGLDGRDYPFGARLHSKDCNAQTGSIAKVTEYPRDRSPFGAFGMGGNAAEWTSAAEGEMATIKGGSFDLPRYRVIVTSFGKRRADLPHADVGFRCARDVK